MSAPIDVLAVGDRVSYDFDGRPCTGKLVQRVPFAPDLPATHFIIVCDNLNQRHRMQVAALVRVGAA